MAGPRANGKFPHRPIQRQPMHDESAVAQNTAFWSMPAAARIVGFNTIMLTQERKVVAPAINSVRRVVPRSDK
mgnify:FL=1